MDATTIQTEGVKRLFHYTRITCLENIFQEKEIKPATLGVEPPEKPVVWCSFRQDWEPTATPAIKEHGGPRRQLTFDEFAKLETPARIEIDPRAAPLNWRAWRKLSGVKARIARSLEEVALRQDANIADWRMSFEPVRVKDGHWLAIELFVQGKWRDFEEVYGRTARPSGSKLCGT